MAIELEIKLVPTDKGVMMLAEANKEYVNMIVSLHTEYDGEYRFVVPSQEDEHMYLVSNTTIDHTVFGNNHLLSRGVMSRLYHQPYSEQELQRWCNDTEFKLRELVSTYRNVLDRMNTDREAIG